MESLIIFKDNKNALTLDKIRKQTDKRIHISQIWSEAVDYIPKKEGDSTIHIRTINTDSLIDNYVTNDVLYVRKEDNVIKLQSNTTIIIKDEYVNGKLKNIDIITNHNL